MSEYDAIVCGSGIAGASIAAELAAEQRVLVVEREDAHGYHTTGRSAALYVESYGNADIRALTAASRGFLEAPPAGFSDYPLMTPRGCLYIATAEQAASLEATMADLEVARSSARRLTGDQAREMVPVLKDVIAGAILEPGTSDIDVGALHGGYLRLARSRGAQVRADAEVVGLERVGGLWRAALRGGETIEAPVFVNAAGAWCDAVAAMAGVARLGLQPMQRTAILIEPPAGARIAGWPAVIDVDEAFYFKPEAGLILASPADETPADPYDAAPDELDVAICVDRIQGAADLPVRRVSKAWAGLRTFSPDRSPVIGFDPAAQGFFWYAGQGGYGMQSGPAAARVGAALAQGRPVPPDIAGFGVDEAALSPARFRS